VLALPAYKRRLLNPFQALLYDEAELLDLHIEDWSFGRALLRRVDLWHLHHPDTVVFPRATWQSLIETCLMFCLLVLARWRGTRIVWTVHDLDSSDARHPRLERLFWRYFLPRLDACIYLSEAGRRLAQERFPSLKGVPAFISPHGDFRPAYANTVSRSDARAALELADEVPVVLSFGLIRPYKGIPELIDTIDRLDANEAVLVVAGRVWDASVEQDIRQRALDASGVRLHLRWVSFDDTQLYFKACDLVVLPYLRILNSGTAMLALAFERPVLVPDRGTMAELGERFGSDWVRTYAGDLDVAGLRTAIEWACHTDRAPPDLAGLDWASLALQIRAIYDATLARQSGMPAAQAASGANGGANGGANA